MNDQCHVSVEYTGYNHLFDLFSILMCALNVILLCYCFDVTYSLPYYA